MSKSKKAHVIMGPSRVFAEKLEAARAAGALEDYGINIVVIDGGFVEAGQVWRVADEILISQAVNLRSWGTTKGLSELRTGKTETTVMDAEGETIIPYARVIKFIPVEQEIWAKQLKEING